VNENNQFWHKKTSGSELVVSLILYLSSMTPRL
jgi:hypothetical protein